MSAKKSRRRRLLLLLGAFLLVAGGATATSLALRPHAHPVAAPKRETPTAREKTYPAVSLPLPEDVRDGVYPSPLPPTCSPGGSTCIVGEANVRTGDAHLLLTDNGGKTW